MTDAPNADLSEAAVNAAAEVSYYYEAERKEIGVIGWVNETEATRERWRQSVRVVVRAYLGGVLAEIEAIRAMKSTGREESSQTVRVLTDGEDGP